MISRTRFAPSPTGPLHLGHAFSAMLASDLAAKLGGEFLIRIEDIDQSRSRPHWEAQIFEDLAWLELSWPTPVLRQSERLAAYDAALGSLWALDLLYPCSCNRRDIEQAASAPQEGAPALGPDGLVYPGTCRDLLPKGGGPWSATPRPRGQALRLNMQRALDHLRDIPDVAGFEEDGAAPDGRRGWISFDPSELVQTAGDIVLARRDMGTSYHLAVVVDDAFQGISHVVRGEDLFDATPLHVILQRLLGLPTPVYHHHRLIRDETGKRLAKRDDARAIAGYRDAGKTPADIRAMVGL